MARIQLAIFAVVLALATAVPSRGARPKTHLPRISRLEANINEYFDEITPEIQSFFIEQGLDPLPLPDFLQSFDVTDLLGIEWHGELGLTTGWLTDLSLFQRYGDATVTYDDLNLNISVSLAFNDIAIAYDYTAQIMDIGPNGKLDGKVEDLVVHLQAGASLADLKLQLYDFEYLSYGTVDLHIDGALLQIIENALLDVVTTLFRGPIMDFVEEQVGNVIANLLESIDLGEIIGGDGLIRSTSLLDRNTANKQRIAIPVKA